MIKIENDENAKEIAQDWTVVRSLRNERSTQWTLPTGSYISTGEPHEHFFNLPLILALGVLDRVLDEYIEQGVFSCELHRCRELARKMKASRKHLKWENYEKVFEAKDARDSIAHKGVLLNREDCIKHIDIIEKELVKWGVVTI